MESLDLLRETIRTLPVRGAPPRFSRAGAWIGLTFLETAIRQNHIRRLTERLTLEEHRAAERTVELDLSLSLLDDLQTDAGLAYSAVRARRSHSTLLSSSKSLLWLPIARLTRRSTSPVDIADADGILVPRLTQFETSRLLASGMYRLLRSILLSDPNATTTSDDVHRLLYIDDEARWVLQDAILTLFLERSKPNHLGDESQPKPPAKKGRPTGYRDLAIRVLDTRADLLAEFYELLTMAIHDYLLVVGLPSSKDEHHLRYSTPLEALEEPGRGRVAALTRQLAPARRGYRLEYTTRISANIPTYHIMAETPHGLNIERMVLCCDADRDYMDLVTSNLAFLSSQLAEHQARVQSSADFKILELELETATRAVSQFVRRRRWDAQQAQGDLNANLLKNALQLSESALANHAFPTADGSYSSSLLVNPSVTPKVLVDAAEEMNDTELQLDFSEENDPITNRAHVYWRRAKPAPVAATSVEAHCSILITDTAIGAAKSVGWFVIGLITVTYALGCSIYESLFPWVWSGGPDPISQPEATIAVMLLVPGFLYSRLDLPARGTIASKLRLLPRVAAYISIGSIALLAAYTAADPSSSRLRWAFWTVLVMQIVLAGILLLRRRLGVRSPSATRATPRPLVAPAWFDRPASIATQNEAADVDARFNTSHTSQVVSSGSITALVSRTS